MVFHESRHGADLNSVRVISGVFKQAVVRVKHLLRQQEEKLPRWSAVVQSGKNIKVQITTHNDQLSAVCLCYLNKSRAQQYRLKLLTDYILYIQIY